jgi:hypothetical protein
MSTEELRDACLHSLRVYFEHPRYKRPEMLLTFPPGDSPAKALRMRGELLSVNQLNRSNYALDTIRVLERLIEEHVRASRAAENEAQRSGEAESTTEEPVQ